MKAVYVYECPRVDDVRDMIRDSTRGEEHAIGIMAAAEFGSLSNLEMRILNRARADDFAIERILGNGCDGLVVAARCTLEGIPDDTKLYAVKMLFTFNQDDQTRRIRNRYENEWKILSQRSHPNVIHMWAEFIDVIPDPFYDNIPLDIQDLAVYQEGARRDTRCRAQFVVFEYHEYDMKRRRPSYPTPLPVGDAKRFAFDLLEAACFLKRSRIVHLDLKLDNIMIAEDGRLVVIDFGRAKQLRSRDMKAVYVEGMSPGGNLAHLAPEVQQQFSDLSRMEIIPDQQERIDYSGQLSWAVGSVIFELITGEHPLVDYPAAYIGYGKTMYRMTDLKPLPACYSSEFQSIVHRLLHCDVTLRCNVEEARGVITRIPDQSCRDDAILSVRSRTKIERLSEAVDNTIQAVDEMHSQMMQIEGSVRGLTSGLQQLETEVRSVSTKTLLAKLQQISENVDHHCGRMVELESAISDINARLLDSNGDTAGQLKMTVDDLKTQMEEMQRASALSKFKELLVKNRLWDNSWVLERRATRQSPWLMSRMYEGDVLRYLWNQRILRKTRKNSNEMKPQKSMSWTQTVRLKKWESGKSCAGFRFSLENLSLRPLRLRVNDVTMYKRVRATGILRNLVADTDGMVVVPLCGSECKGSITVEFCNFREANSCWLTVGQLDFSLDEKGTFKAVDIPLDTQGTSYDAVRVSFTLSNPPSSSDSSYVIDGSNVELFGHLVVGLR